MQAEGRTFPASFALASRVRNYGGDLEIAPTISLLDDEFELVLFEGASSFTFLKYMLGVVVHRHQHMRGVTILRTRKAVFLRAGGQHRSTCRWMASIPALRRDRRDCSGCVDLAGAAAISFPPARQRRMTRAWTTSPTR